VDFDELDGFDALKLELLRGRQASQLDLLLHAPLDRVKERWVAALAFGHLPLRHNVLVWTGMCRLAVAYNVPGFAPEAGFVAFFGLTRII
jgi:hypothetical protein